MTTLADRLERALAGRYRLERELGAGGMAIVWLAEDLKHRRRVAIKVLRPELAASLGPQRFVREIEIAAQLQHPHILPLLDSGEADGLAYYVMPYVEGESLRERLQRERALPLGEAMRVVREVADALAYAHRRGVVHRDVKPDNVMLQDGHALVMDFGVAKAVSEARSESVTTVGMAIGTPAYMAPEQAAGDPNVDFRADLYALGCLAYEVLGGRPPFTGGTPQQVLAAHLTKAPEPLSTVRPDVPPALEAAVMKCLAKAPGERWGGAAEFRAALETTPLGSTPVQTMAIRAPSAWYGHPLRTAAQYLVVAAAILGLTYFLVMQAGLPDWVLRAAAALLAAGLPVLVATGLLERRRAVARATGLFHASAETGLGRHMTWRRATTGGGIAFATLLLAAGLYQVLGARGIGPGASLVGKGSLAARDRIVVADFQNRAADTTLGASITEAFRIDLGQTSLVSVLTATQLQAALQRMGRAPGSALDTATARELAVREGAKAYVVGDISPVGTSYQLAVRLVAASDGSELVALREQAAGDGELLAAVDRLSGRLRERMGESLREIRAGEPLQQVTTSSLEALRLFGQAQAASSRADYDETVKLLKQAIAIDSGFAMAWRKLAAIYGNMRAPISLRIDAATRAYRFRDRLPPLERDQATAQYFWSVDYRPDSAERAFKAILERSPDDITALNNYGILLNRLKRRAEAEAVLARGLAIDSGISSFYVNLGAALVAQGRTDDAARVYDIFERHVPEAADRIPLLRMERLAAMREFDSIPAVAEAGRRRAKDPADYDVVLGSVAMVQGRLRASDQHYAEAERTTLATGGQPQDVVGTIVARMLGVLEYRRDTTTARRMLRDALARYPLRAPPAVDRSYLGLADLYMSMNEREEARRMLREFRDSTPAASTTNDRRARELEAELDAREGRDVARALATLRGTTDSAPCTPCANAYLARLYDDLGMPDSALARYERAVPPVGDGDELWEGGFWLPRTYKRLGELHERRGNRPKALAYYSKFVELWRNADPELQPTVREVKQRMADLAGEPR